MYLSALRSQNAPEVTYNLGCAYLAQHDYLNALQIFEKLNASGHPTYEALNNLALVQHHLMNQKQAVDSLKQALAIQPRIKLLVLNLVSLYNSTKQYREAANLYQATDLTAIEDGENPTLITLYLKLGNRYVAEKEYAAALALYEKALQITPQNSLIYNNIGVVRMLTGQQDLARGSFLKGLEINPADGNCLLNLGIYHEQLGNFQAAYSKYKQFLTANNKSVTVQAWIETYRRLFHYD
ncbi:tetratricopeptide repeat protein [candidate division CSSED10-310 bacterium]|uniref:Tetratricopeptide repeat protein n=1 Tax=candidate division CSSED10-310 bacterium TaxID=2855610 RepID=A0ABV6Z3P9_UNCC1